MSYERCASCKEWHWKDKPCPPIYYFKHEDWGDAFEEIRAYDYEDAAERFAKQYNEDGDYCLMDSSTEVIISDGKIEKNFRVSAEPDINYHRWSSAGKR
jgi:hypothetical protein